MPIRLYLQNEETNKNRFYTIQVQPDLFGCYSVIREWGRLDNKGGKIRITPALTETQAHRVAKRAKEYRITRGYSDTYA